MRKALVAMALAAGFIVAVPTVAEAKHHEPLELKSWDIAYECPFAGYTVTVVQYTGHGSKTSTLTQVDADDTDAERFLATVGITVDLPVDPCA